MSGEDSALAFVYDPAIHRPFRRRHVTHVPTPRPALTSAQVSLLRHGLPKYDMDVRWQGNAAPSLANAVQREIVVRLYRSWTNHLIFEARYRPVPPTTPLPANDDSPSSWSMYELAYEGDETIFRSDVQAALASYLSSLNVVLRHKVEFDNRVQR